MDRIMKSNMGDLTGMIIAVAAGLFIFLIVSFQEAVELPSSLLNLNTIFISILIEALPFVLIGVLIAGFIQIFVTEDHIKKWIPKNKYMAILMSCTAGALFPACECGIVPIIRRLVGKGVPIYAGIGFMLTGPLINPIVIASTYMAFGNDAKMAGLRMGLGFVIALASAFAVSLFFKGNQFKKGLHTESAQSMSKAPFTDRLWSMLTHSIDEFFDMAKYLILGAFLASFVQVYLPARTLLEAGSGPVTSLLVMMGLAYILSLCSEADAFIGASFGSIFPPASVLGFLIFGPMIDLKNTLMMLSVFRKRFVLSVLLIVAAAVFATLLIVQGLW
ncbi:MULTISPECIES: permease [Bacillaceae]|uniref:permease n=1 Tax=Bacillaceae TaxID=186817 RepID=UPI002964B5C4|nr:permease [Bacillus infantis]MDW2877842.1 permease [Bacillus infantis]